MIVNQSWVFFFVLVEIIKRKIIYRIFTKFPALIFKIHIFVIITCKKQ